MFTAQFREQERAKRAAAAAVKKSKSFKSKLAKASATPAPTGVTASDKRSGKGGTKLHYTIAQQITGLSYLARFGNAVRAAHRALVLLPGFSKLSRPTLSRWRANVAKHGIASLSPSGRRPSASERFEIQVFEELVFQRITDIGGVERKLEAETVANVCFSYNMIRAAVERVRKRPEWSSAESITKLSMSNDWCQAFVRRAFLSRHRVTTRIPANLPSRDTIKKAMDEIQALSGDCELDLIVNMDETAAFPNGAAYQFIADDQTRAATHDHGNKDRITAIMAASAAGSQLPTAFIIRCAAGGADGVRAGSDQSRIRVLHELMGHASGAFSARLGWEHKHYVWDRRVLVKKDGTDVETPVRYKRAYLINSHTGDAVFAQSKAWADSAVIEMWTKFVLIPYVQRTRSSLQLPETAPALLVWDNAPAHKHHAQFGTCNINVAFLPPNCTSELQVSICGVFFSSSQLCFP